MKTMTKMKIEQLHTLEKLTSEDDEAVLIVEGWADGSVAVLFLGSLRTVLATPLGDIEVPGGVPAVRGTTLTPEGSPVRMTGERILDLYRTGVDALLPYSGHAEATDSHVHAGHEGVAKAIEKHASKLLEELLAKDAAADPFTTLTNPLRDLFR